MESDLNDFEFWPDFDAPNFILEALDVDERFGDRVVPGVGLNDEGQEVFLQIWNAFLEALRIDQSRLEVFGRRQTWLDLFSAVCNVISEKKSIINEFLCFKQIFQTRFYWRKQFLIAIIQDWYIQY